MPDHYVWLRRTLDLPDGLESSPLAIPLGKLTENYQVFVNGRQIAQVGDSTLEASQIARPRTFDLPAFPPGRTTIAGAILSALNDGLRGQTSGGFVTCCCARLDPDGTVTIAHAGHPSPYCDGREVVVEPGLPLGVVRGTEYAETVVSGKQFTFVSDGVVEAENDQRELFGFDRTREILMKSAAEIADAAKAWGQNEDITVVDREEKRVTKLFLGFAFGLVAAMAQNALHLDISRDWRRSNDGITVVTVRRKA